MVKPNYPKSMSLAWILHETLLPLAFLWPSAEDHSIFHDTNPPFFSKCVFTFQTGGVSSDGDPKMVPRQWCTPEAL